MLFIFSSNIFNALLDNKIQIVHSPLFLSVNRVPDDVRNSRNPVVASASKENPCSTAAESQQVKGGNRETGRRVTVPDSMACAAQSGSIAITGDSNRAEVEEIEEQV